MTIYQWMKEDQFPKPTTTPNFDDGAFEESRLRGDIESWNPEALKGDDE